MGQQQSNFLLEKLIWLSVGSFQITGGFWWGLEKPRDVDGEVDWGLSTPPCTCCIDAVNQAVVIMEQRRETWCINAWEVQRGFLITFSKRTSIMKLPWRFTALFQSLKSTVTVGFNAFNFQASPIFMWFWVAHFGVRYRPRRLRNINFHNMRFYYCYL